MASGELLLQMIRFFEVCPWSFELAFLFIIMDPITD
jgi:hypothetical protein